NADLDRSSAAHGHLEPRRMLQRLLHRLEQRPPAHRPVEQHRRHPHHRRRTIHRPRLSRRNSQASARRLSRSGIFPAASYCAAVLFNTPRRPGQFAHEAPHRLRFGGRAPLPAIPQQGELRDRRELVPVFRQPGDSLHLLLVQYQQHEHVVGHVPFASDTACARRLKSETWVEVRVSQHDDERTACIVDLPVPGFHQLAADALTLTARPHSHRAKRGTLNVAHRRGTVKDVSDYLAVYGCHQRQQYGCVRPQGVNDATFLLLAKGTVVHVSDRPNVIWTFFADVEHAQPRRTFYWNRVVSGLPVNDEGSTVSDEQVQALTAMERELTSRPALVHCETRSNSPRRCPSASYLTA